MAQMIGEQLEKPMRTLATPKIVFQMLGLTDSFMREFVEMFYQYTEPQIVDSRAFEQTFGIYATPIEDALAATLDWYRDHIHMNQQAA